MQDAYWTFKKLLELMEDYADIECVEYSPEKGIYISGKNDGKTLVIGMSFGEG